MSDLLNRRAEMNEKVEDSIKTGFDAFLAKDTTKLLLAQIPSALQPETVEVLLKSAFEAGHSTGVGMILMDMMMSVLKKDDRR